MAKLGKFGEAFSNELLAKTVIELGKGTFSKQAQIALDSAADPGSRAELLDVIDELEDKEASKSIRQRINDARSVVRRRELKEKLGINIPPENRTIKAMCRKLDLVKFYDNLKCGISGYEALKRSLTRLGKKSERDFWEEINGLVHDPFISWIQDNLMDEGLLSDEAKQTLQSLESNFKTMFKIPELPKFSEHPIGWFKQYFRPRRDRTY